MNRRALRTGVVAMLLVALWPLSQAAAAPLSILYHEPFRTAQPATTAKPLSAAPAPATALRFDAFGKRFDVTLDPNERIAAAVRSGQPGVEVYRGELAGRQGTWARLNRRGTEWTGAVFDGSELYIIERYEDVRPLLTLARPNDGGTIVYRWSDATGDLVDELATAPASDGNAPRMDTAAMLEAFAAETLLYPSLDLAIGFVGDFELTERSGVRATDNMLETINVLDGIFGQQLGLYITPQLTTFTTSADPFNSDVPVDLLHELEEYKCATPQQRVLGLVHLFTGRDLIGTGGNGGQVLGIANRAAVCEERFGVSLSRGVARADAALIAAHEIAHSLGAPHDGDLASACAATPAGYLMSPVLNGSSTLSQCSLDEIARVLAAKTCLAPPPPVDVSVEFGYLAPAPVEGYTFSAEVIVTTPPTGSPAHDAVLSFDASGGGIGGRTAAPHGWTCASPTVCTIHSLPAGRSDRFTLILYSEQPTMALHAEVVSLNDPNPANNSVDHAFSLGPAADVGVTVTPYGGVEAHPGEERAFTVNVKSLRFGDAVTRLEIVGSFLYDIVSVVPLEGSCVTTLTKADCDLLTIPVGESRQIVVRLRMHDEIGAGPNELWRSSSVLFEASVAGASEPNSSDNFVSLNVVVSERFVDLEATVKGRESLAPGENASYEFSYRNTGPETATNVRLVASYSQTEPVTALLQSVTGAAVCADEYQSIVCTVPAMAPGEAVVAVVDVRPASSWTHGGFSLEAFAEQPEYDSVQLNNVGRLAVAVNPALAPPVDPPPVTPTPVTPPPAASGGGGGGGGSMGFDWLALLAAAVVSRWRSLRRGA